MSARVCVTVRCGGKHHHISLSSKGRLIFHDHDKSLWLTEDLAELADNIAPACRCAQVLRWWRGGNWGIYWTFSDARNARNAHRTAPADLKRAHERNVCVAMRRSHNSRRDPLTVPLEYRMWTRTCDMAREAFWAADYRRPSDKWAGGEVMLCLNKTTGQPFLRTETTRAQSSNGKWSGKNLEVSLSLRENWCLRVHRRGLALVQDQRDDRRWLVLDANKAGTQAVIATQGRGLSVNLKTVAIATDSSPPRVIRELTKGSAPWASNDESQNAAAL